MKVGPASVEVLATCSYESSIRCIDVKGNRSQEYEKKLSEFFARQTAKGYSPTVTYQIGQNNQAVIYRFSQQAGPFEPTWLLFATPPSYTSPSLHIDEGVGRFPRPTGLCVSYFSVPRNSRSAQLSGLLDQPLRTSPAFKVAPGETVLVGPHQFQVQSVKPMPYGKSWIVRLVAIKTVPGELDLHLRCSDSTGRLIEYVNGSGKPVTESERTELLNQYANESRQSASVSRTIMGAADAVLIKTTDKNTFEARIAIDPQFIKEATLSGRMRVLYEIRDIPLAPK